MIIFFPLILILILIGIFQLYEYNFRYHITAKFAESGPLNNHMPVYYKGYKIGQTKDVKLTKDYQYTLVKMILYTNKPKLPANITAKIKKREMKNDYIELVLPDEPSSKLLKNWSIIEGEPAFDLESFLSTITNSDILNPVIDNFAQLLSSINDTSDEMGDFFTDSRKILKDNRQNLKQTTKSLSRTTKSLTEISSRLNKSITDEKLNNTTTSVEKSSANILEATENIKNITEKADSATDNLDETIQNIDSTICETHAVASNIKKITAGLREVMGKRFAGLRIIFGKPIKNDSCPNNYSK